MVRRFLDEVRRSSCVKTPAFFDAWAKTYDEEVAESGYAAPRRCARALAAAMTERDRPVLDLGCGTGLSGVALRAEGFSIIDGWDPSSEMLARAEARNVYRVLRQIEADRPLTAAPGSYIAVVAVGVFSPGMAPPEAMDQVFQILASGGYFCFSLNDHAISHSAYEGRVKEITDAGGAQVISHDYGDHLRNENFNSTVYVLKKT
ncbi:class I SAM-dependent methyltransferase [Pikeienuella sp. HZG-20]|uniref:class I SAM-dependent DNA methyltransferase n=1 Tax=Paludibacillus litoralis TaxID=3133267 RepID=UPI0030EE7C39